jgi:hypothetical protein
MTACVRTAWLDLNGSILPLEDVSAGYFCQSLDLGAPVVREVVSNRPGQDGVDDRTQYLAGRVVTASITALAGAGAQIDAVAASFGPYMNPAVRPVLHYVLDRPGSPERTMILRASAYGWPIVGAWQRDINLQWLAADPTALDPTVRSATAWSGASVVTGRTYPLTFNRIYPAGGGTGPISGRIQTLGDLGVRPTLTVYGPIEGATITFDTVVSGQHFVIPFEPSFIIGGNTFVVIDTANKTAYLQGDPGQPVMADLDWLHSTWPVIPPAPDRAIMSLAGTSTTSVTQVVATWQDRYLS